MRRIFFLLPLILFIASCSIEKRHYRDGFYFDWNRHQPGHENYSLKRFPDDAVADIAEEDSGIVEIIEREKDAAISAVHDIPEMQPVYTASIQPEMSLTDTLRPKRGVLHKDNHDEIEKMRGTCFSLFGFVSLGFIILLLLAGYWWMALLMGLFGFAMTVTGLLNLYLVLGCYDANEGKGLLFRTQKKNYGIFAFIFNVDLFLLIPYFPYLLLLLLVFTFFSLF